MIGARALFRVYGAVVCVGFLLAACASSPPPIPLEKKESATYMRDDDFESCRDGYFVSASDTTVSRIGGEVTLNLWGVYYRDGDIYANIAVGDWDEGFGATLQVGEALPYPGVGTFTLLSGYSKEPAIGKTGPTDHVSLCFEPAVGFQYAFADIEQPVP